MRRLTSAFFDIPVLRPGTVSAYAFAFVCTAVVTALRIAIDPYVVGVQFITFFPAVIVATLIGGFGAGVFCAALSGAAAVFFVLPPRLSFYIDHPGEVAAVGLFVLVAFANVILVAGMRLAVEGYRELSRKLEHRIEEHGAELTKARERIEIEAAFRAMFNVSSVGKAEVELKSGRFLRANAAMCKYLGYSEEELLARTVYEVTNPDDADVGRALSQRLDAGESAVFDVEKRYIRKDGKEVWARTTVNVIRDAFGRPLRHTAVIQDLTARKQAEQDLYASKVRLQLALDAAQLGWWEYDPVRRVFSGDRRAREVCDYAENELTLEEFLGRVHRDDMERFSAVREAALDPVDPKPYVNEYRMVRRDGTVRWVESRGLAYFEGAGPERRLVSFVGTVQDITQRKEREERERLLMREINHRAKNMLSVVDAIAHQTATRNPEDFIARFSERIQALSANQDLLVRNEWNGVEIEDLVHAQLAHFADLIGSRIATHGPKLHLNPASAQAIGLALHELATNAGKYGALSTDRGRVDVSWGTVGSNFTMSWTEHDGPPVCKPKQRGFGTTVIEAMAEYSVDGAVDLHYAPSGVTWRLTCPTMSVLESK
jgi:PAS domain S-box-containing protein